MVYPSFGIFWRTLDWKMLVNVMLEYVKAIWYFYGHLILKHLVAFSKTFLVTLHVCCIGISKVMGIYVWKGEGGLGPKSKTACQKSLTFSTFFICWKAAIPSNNYIFDWTSFALEKVSRKM
jgi:hypothetical protein